MAKDVSRLTSGDIVATKFLALLFHAHYVLIAALMAGGKNGDRRRDIALARAVLSAGAIVILVLTDSASAASFAQTHEERAAAIKQGEQGGAMNLAVFPRNIDSEGRTYVQLDDMRFVVQETEAPESAFTGNRWTNGIVYYVFASNVSATNRTSWQHAATIWSNGIPALRFIEGTGNGNYIYVQNSDSNDSYIGMVGGRQDMHIVTWSQPYFIAHEIGHALGLIHEHQRTDRGPYVQINSGNVQSEYYSNNFPIIPSTVYGDYDFDSVMHYDRCAFSIDCPDGASCYCTHYTITVLPPYTEWQYRIGQRSHLSPQDQAGMTLRYGSGGGSVPNDQCSAAIALSNGVARSDSTVNATSTGDPASSCAGTINHGVWYTFTPGTNGTITVSTCGSDFDTVLQVYTGSCAALTPVPNGCDDDNGPSCSGTQASVSFNGTVGTTYRILAGGYGFASGQLQIVARVAAAVPSATTYDFNGDGHTDYLLYNSGTQQSAIWYLNNNVHTAGAYGPSIPAGWSAAAVADFNRDAKPDLTLFNPSTGQTMIWYLNNNVFVSSASGPTLPSGWVLAGAADFNGDGKPDYILFKASTRQTAIWYMNNNAYVGGAYGPTLPVGWSFVCAADINRDGNPDFILFYASTRNSVIWYMSGVTRTSGAGVVPIPSGFVLHGADDFNGDNKPDFVLFNPATRQTGIWYMDGYARIYAANGPTLPSGWTLAEP